MAVEALSQICADVPKQSADQNILRPFSIPNPRTRVQFGQGAVLQQFPNPTFRARAQLVRGSQRSIMNAAQGRPRKRGALHNRGAGGGGSTSTIFMSPPCQDFGELSRVTTFILSLRDHYASLPDIDVNDQLRDRQRRGRQINNNR